MDGKAFSRRGLIRGGLGIGAAAGLGALAGCQTTQASPAPATVHSQAAVAPPVSVTRYVSAALDGAGVDLVIMRPEGVAAQDLPVCLALHPENAGAEAFVELGVPAMLTEVVRAGAPPFAVVAVDSGNDGAGTSGFWVGEGAVNPQRMLAEEVPGWLARTELAHTAFAVFGISGGAYGALNYARGLGVGIIGAISPAVFGSWPEAAPRFPDRALWESTEPLRHLPEFAGFKLGVWSGTADSANGSARQLAAWTGANPAVFGPGGRDTAYWKATLPETLAYVGTSLATSGIAEGY